MTKYTDGEVDRAWRREVWRERVQIMTGLFLSVTPVLIAGSLIYIYCPQYLSAILGLVSAIGIPFSLWLERRGRKG